MSRGESGESIDRVIEFARSFVDRNEYLFSAVKDFDFARVPLKMLAPQFKHPAFEEEQEWRVIQPTHKFLECRKKFRAGKSMLVPYIELALAEDPYFIKEVFVGPSPNTSLSVASVKGLFESHSHSDVEVRESQIPYRYW